jgi:hypothetical protein
MANVARAGGRVAGAALFAATVRADTTPAQRLRTAGRTAAVDHDVHEGPGRDEPAPDEPASEDDPVRPDKAATGGWVCRPEN